MNYTFQRVAAHCGLRLSYYTTTALLALIFLVLSLTEYRTPSPLYILLSLAVLPSIVKAMLFSGKKDEKRGNDLAFPLFCKKYGYDPVMYKSMNIAYLLMFVLLAAWQISYRRSDNIPSFISFLPVLLAAASLLLRILGIICYRLYFYLFPLKAMR